MRMAPAVRKTMSPHGPCLRRPPRKIIPAPWNGRVHLRKPGEGDRRMKPPPRRITKRPWYLGMITLKRGLGACDVLSRFRIRREVLSGPCAISESVRIAVVPEGNCEMSSSRQLHLG